MSEQLEDLLVSVDRMLMALSESGLHEEVWPEYMRLAVARVHLNGLRTDTERAEEYKAIRKAAEELLSAIRGLAKGPCPRRPRRTPANAGRFLSPEYTSLFSALGYLDFIATLDSRPHGTRNLKEAAKAYLPKKDSK